MTNSKFEDLCYLTAIIWMPAGVIAKSMLVFAIGVIALGIGLMTLYVRRNKQVNYKPAQLPTRREDDTVELKLPRDDRDHTYER